MTSERWQQLDELFHAALERAPEERAAFLAEACAGDDSLRKPVEDLLAGHEAAGSFIERPAMEVAARSVANDQDESAVGLTIGHYQIVSTLGVGGMGEVYLAQDNSLGRQIALKLLPAAFTRDSDRVRRFQQEARAVSALNHPNIVTIHEIGQVDGRHFIATEFIDGETLRAHVSGTHSADAQGGADGKLLNLAEILNVMIQTADALSAAHEAGIVHRDIKPENIMVRRRDGYVKVLDFGLAKLTEGPTAETEATTRPLIQTSVGIIMGTAGYMSPEQARGEKVDVRTDIWSLGVVLYEMVAGCAPFERPTPSEVIALILEREPPPLTRYVRNVPERLQQIVGKALTKNRDERYQSAKDLFTDLQQLKQTLEGRGQVERSVGPQTGSSKDAETDSRQSAAVTRQVPVKRTSGAQYIVHGIQKHKGAFALIGLVVLAAVLLGAGLFTYRNRSQPLTEKDTILIADFVNTTGDEQFDGALKQALAKQLEQSPFLNIFPEERVQDTLKSMRSPDAPVTREVAREICERQGLKAMIVGSIGIIGSQYVIGLEAVNARTSEVLAREQEEAAGKEQVLSALRKAATGLREKLGESLSSIQKFDAPTEATTSSLAALKAYSEGQKLHVQNKDREAIPLLKNAVALDPQFAMAYGVLAAAYNTSGDTKASQDYFTKAFELRERAGEQDKHWIMAQYYKTVTGELDKAIGEAELLKQIYPRSAPARFMLGFMYGSLGQYERAVKELQEAVRLDPNWPWPYRRLAIWLRYVGRFAEARAVLEQADARKIEVPGRRLELYYLAFLQGDTGEMQRQMETLSTNPSGLPFLELQASTAEAAGQFRKAREFRAQQVGVLLKRDTNDAAAGQTAGNAETAGLYGHCDLARQEAANGLAIARTPSSLNSAALALAMCGELGKAQSLADEYGELEPGDTMANAVDLPVIRAAIANHRANYARAIELLKQSQRYDRADSTIFAHYIRAQAFLGQQSAAEAATEFQYILDNRRIDPFSPLHPLAQLGLARAYALQGDIEKTRKAYDDFFEPWKDADLDLPILITARKEQTKLK